ncbi:MAG: hypothetical protein IKC69_04320 [Clostridia bacterium]|nr:hypothetical protein [Clostridia bacterium]
MKTKLNHSQYKKIALVLSLCVLILWAVLGTGASLAWFTDETPEMKNIFHFADFELEVSHRTEDMKWKSIDGASDIFDDEALYEPGYTQVVYLRVDNKGEVPFDFKTAVSVVDYTVATNVFGQQFNLQDYLLFGLADAKTEAEMDALVDTREKADAIATTKLNNYSTDAAELGAGESVYFALVVRMPRAIDNVANFRGTEIPKVELGIIATATQKKD